MIENKNAVELLAALAQESRLAVFRLLVQHGPEGMAAGKIAERLGIAANTLSFHLKELTHAGLLNVRQEGRFMFYAANYRVMAELMSFMMQNCCGGQNCTGEQIGIDDPGAANNA